MGWSIGGPDQHGRQIGYGVPAYCDHPKCTAEIDRGLAYVCCDSEPYGGERGCGLYFCHSHGQNGDHRCSPCEHGRKPYKPKREHPKWVFHLLNHHSWAQWRNENPTRVAELRQLAKDDEAVGIRYTYEGDEPVEVRA